MDFTTVLGLVAGTLTTISFIPQLVRTWKTKSAKDVSLGMLVVFCAGVFLWLIYGISIQALPVMLSNFVTLVLAGIILILKLKYD